MTENNFNLQNFTHSIYLDKPVGEVFVTITLKGDNRRTSVTLTQKIQRRRFKKRFCPH